MHHRPTLATPALPWSGCLPPRMQSGHRWVVFPLWRHNQTQSAEDYHSSCEVVEPWHRMSVCQDQLLADQDVCKGFISSAMALTALLVAPWPSQSAPLLLRLYRRWGWLEMICVGGCWFVEGIVPRGWRIIETLVIASRNIQARTQVVEVVGKIYTCAGCQSHGTSAPPPPLLRARSNH